MRVISLLNVLSRWDILLHSLRVYTSRGMRGGPTDAHRTVALHQHIPLNDRDLVGDTRYCEVCKLCSTDLICVARLPIGLNCC